MTEVKLVIDGFLSDKVHITLKTFVSYYIHCGKIEKHTDVYYKLLIWRIVINTSLFLFILWILHLHEKLVKPLFMSQLFITAFFRKFVWMWPMARFFFAARYLTRLFSAVVMVAIIVIVIMTFSVSVRVTSMSMTMRFFMKIIVWHKWVIECIGDGYSGSGYWRGNWCNRMWRYLRFVLMWPMIVSSMFMSMTSTMYTRKIVACISFYLGSLSMFMSSMVMFLFFIIIVFIATIVLLMTMVVFWFRRRMILTVFDLLFLNFRN